MQIGLMMDSLTEMTLEEALDAAASLGIEAVEIPLGNWSPAPHVDFEALVADPAARRRLDREVVSRGMTVDSLNASGNQLHPVSGPGESRVVEETIRIAGDLGITKVVLMSGLPGAPGDTAPNWITSSWPAETGQILEYQWSEVAIPWWHRLADHARACGVTRLALELHPGQLVYNVRSFRRLRAEIGDLVGVNMDPSHLFWMGADPLAAIDALGDAVYHVHAKDTRIEPLRPSTPATRRCRWRTGSTGRGTTSRSGGGRSAGSNTGGPSWSGSAGWATTGSFRSSTRMRR